VQLLAQDYDPDRSTGWLLMSNLEQAVWFVQEYEPSRTSYQVLGAPSHPRADFGR